MAILSFLYLPRNLIRDYLNRSGNLLIVIIENFVSLFSQGLDETRRVCYNIPEMDDYNDIRGNQLTAEDTGSLMFFYGE